MIDNGKSLFREKNLKHATDPEQLNSYLKVTSFSAWFVVIAAALVLAAIFIWAFFGKIQTSIQGAGYCTNGIVMCYLEKEDMEGIVKGEKADVGGFEGTVTDIGTDLFMSFDIPYDVLYLLPEDDNMWYSQVVISCNAPDGLYSVKLHQKETRPVSFLSGGK